MGNLKYCSYDKLSVWYNTDEHSFRVLYSSCEIIRDAAVQSIRREGRVFAPSDFAECSVRYKRSDAANETLFQIVYKNTDDTAVLSFLVSDSKISVFSDGAEFEISGTVMMPGESGTDVFPACLGRQAKDLRASIGNGATRADNALYSRRTDRAVVIGESGKTQLSHTNVGYSFYNVIGAVGTDICVKENVIAKKYNVIFNPVNKNSTFSTPPMGWMTWYAVKFDACEEKVLENAQWQAENLKDFGANAVWVDWEWYHEKLYSTREDGVNSLNPDPVKYPNGLAAVASKIKNMGLVPCLWIGYTNEPCKNEYIEKYPDIILTEELAWCGKYFYDFSNPRYLEEYLPVALKNVQKWGYEAVKYDVLPSAISQHEKNHANMYDLSLTTKEAFRNMIKTTRSILGENTYMLSCSAAASAEVLWASDMFDAARIGQDIFSWSDFLLNCVDKVKRYYPLHNIQLYNDPDNVVIREEFNSFEQAKTRVSLVSLLGMPMTFGDEFSALDENRIDLLKRSLPILDIHPSDLFEAAFDNDRFLVNLNIEKAHESYLVSGVFNMTDANVKSSLSLRDDLHLPDGEYLVYDFYRDEFLGKITRNFELENYPYECRILAIRPFAGVPQIVSTSRHITQGAAEISDMKFENNILEFCASLIKGDEYTVRIHMVQGYSFKDCTEFQKVRVCDNILYLTLIPKETETKKFEVRFEVSSINGSRAEQEEQK